MRISDWSSDVCSSDLDEPAAGLGLVILATCAPPVAQEAFEVFRPSVRQQRDQKQAPVLPRRLPRELLHPPKIVVQLAGQRSCALQRPGDRKSTRLNSSH